MEYAQLGKTGLMVSRLGLGTVAIGDDSISEDNCYNIVEAAVEAGINVFDTSPFYGDGEAQRKLGYALEEIMKGHDIDRKSLVIGTKTGHFTNPEHSDFSYETTKRSVEHSLNILGYLDYVLLHDIEHGNMNEILGEALICLQEYKRKGAIKHIGVSGAVPSVLSEAIKTNEFDIVLTYRQYTPICQEAEGLIAEAYNLNLGVINGSPLSFGMLVGKDPKEVVKNRPWHPDYKNLDAARHLYKISKEPAIPIIQVALNFPMQNNKISTTLVGPKNVSELNVDVELAFRELPVEIRGHRLKDFIDRRLRLGWPIE